MGTTLTGTTPQDTYDSLIKVTDNGPIGASPKLLSDGLGNDSSLALSTTFTAVRGGQQLRLYRTDNAVYGSIEYIAGGVGFKFDDVNSDGYRFVQGANTAMAINTSGNVGIGTSAPTIKLDVETGAEGITAGFAGATYGVRIDNGGTFSTDASTIHGVNSTLTASYQPLRLNGSYTALCVNNTEVVRATANGLTFNGDTAAANALDDYEEGEWTPTFTDTLGNNVTASSVGRYTKIGRQVTLSLTTTWSNKSAADIGSLVYMSGVPFNMNNKANGIVTYYDDMNLTTVGAFTIANAGTTLCYFPIQDNAVEASFLTFGETTNTSTFWFTLTYFV